jgi:anti-anti-sigma factor
MERPGVLNLRQQTIRDHPDAVHVVIDGSIDPKTQTRFRDEMQALLAKGVKRFLFDCGKLTYINSSGLAFLLSIVSTVKPKGGGVALAAVDPKIQVIFKMMEITQLFQFYPSFADALRELDEKLARELADVGPALKLEEPKPAPPPPPKTSRMIPVGKPRPVTDRIPKASRPIVRPPPPPANPIVRFFRALFGIEDGPSVTRRRRR